MELNEQLLFTPNNAARALDISRSKVYALMASGDLKFVMVGADRRIPRDELRRIAEHGVSAKA